MRYPEADITQMMGIGEYMGEIRQAPDGNLYQWVEGIDGLGRRGGFWKRFKRRARRVVKKAAPIARRVARMTPAGRRALKLLPIAKRIARRAGVAGYDGYDGIGALYETPDGSIYQMSGIADYEDLDGLAEEEELSGLGQNELISIMGIGTLGEIQQGPDGNLYQWVEDDLDGIDEGLDGLGRRRRGRRRRKRGRWKRFKRRLKRGFRKVRGGVKKVLRKALPIASTAATFLPIPGARAAAAGIRAATPLLRKAGFAGLGELYEAPDGTVYQLQGIGDYSDIDGLAYEDELDGLADDYDDIEGLAYEDEDELDGLAEDYDELEGLAYEDEDELDGLAEDYDELEGLAYEDEDEDELDGYVQHQNNLYGVEGYVPHLPPATRWLKESVPAPKIWEAPW